MAHLALYREWRPKSFDEVVEQKQAVHALRQSVLSGQIAHAYLFSGTRGTGKTTMAKIFARAINCLAPLNGNPCNQCAICLAALDGSLLDIVEMDAASNNSVDNIRRMCDEVVFMPAQARFKVYIIDEVHMLSTGAFNALLKTLEEPPAHAVFILATTEPHRIPATITSRCQRYEFRRIPVESMIGRLAAIAAANQIELAPDSLQAIAALADGALRDAISLLDQARAAFAGLISRDDILSLAGVARDEFLQQVTEALVDGQIPELLRLVDQLVMAGRDLARFVTDLAQYLRNMMVCQVTEDPHLLIRVTSDTLTDMRRLADRLPAGRLIELIRGLSSLLSDLRWAADGRTALEIGLIRLAGPPVQPAALLGQRPAPAQLPLPASPEPKPALSPGKPILSLPEKPAVLPTSPALLPEELVTAPDPAPHPPVSANVPIQDPAPDVDATADHSDADVLWQRLLDSLIESGQMTLYLFGRSARAMRCPDGLQLVFAEADTINYQEFNKPATLKLLRDSLSRLTGAELNVRVCQAGSAAVPTCTVPVEAEWIRKVRQTAHVLGIPVKVEE